MEAGYSGRPLAEKLGIRPGMTIAILHAPPGYLTELGPLQEGVTILDHADGPIRLIQAFFDRETALREECPRLKAALTPTGSLWLSWPKRASGWSTDLTDSLVRSVGLENGLVDVKIIAVDSTWSGLKFVYRLKDRA